MMANDISKLDNSHPVDLTLEPRFFLGSVEARPLEREVIGAAGREVIEPRVMQVLVALARAQGEAVTRDELIGACWEGRIVSEDAINRVIHKIRKLSETAGGFKLETITKVGYRLVPQGGSGEARLAAAPPPAEAIATPTPGAQGPSQVRNAVRAIETTFRRRPRSALIAALGLFCLVVGAYWAWGQSATMQVTAAPTVAVLPFEPLYVDPDAQYFSDGVASSIANTLTSVGVAVVSPSQSFRYRGAAQADAARALGASYIVGGDVRREGDTMRISVRIDDVTRGVTLLAQTFEGPASDTAILREQVAARTAGILAYTLKGGSEAEVTAALLPIVAQIRFSDQTQEAYVRIRALARQHPDDPRAQLLLAYLSSVSLAALPEEERSRAVREGRAAAERALRLDPNASQAYLFQQGLTPTYLWAEREALHRRALETAPDGPYTFSTFGAFYINSGRGREGAPLLARGVVNDPLEPGIVTAEIRVLAQLGRFEDAAPLLARARRLWPGHRQVAAARFDVAFMSGAYGEADDLLRDPDVRVQLAIPPIRLSTLQSLTRTLKTGGARERAEFLAACASVTIPHCLIGAAMLGELDLAFAVGERAYPDLRATTPASVEARWLATIDELQSWPLFMPQTAPLRTDPRFTDIVTRIGLVDYWRESGHPPDFCETESAPVCALLRR